MTSKASNALNIPTIGLISFDGTATFTPNSLTQYSVLCGDASGKVSLIAPSATVGYPLISQGVSSPPIFTTLKATAVQGATTGTAPAAGYIGEIISANVISTSSVALTNNTPATIASITLSAGIWDIYLNGCFRQTSSGTLDQVAISTTTNSFAGTQAGLTLTYYARAAGDVPTVSGIIIPKYRVNISTPTTYYYVAQCAFSGIRSAYGSIQGVRIG